MTFTGVMQRLINSNATLQSDATPRTLSGGGAYRPLFVKSGTVTIKNMNMNNGLSQGGDGGYGNNATGGRGQGSAFGGGGMFGKSAFSAANRRQARRGYRLVEEITGILGQILASRFIEMGVLPDLAARGIN